MAEQKSGSSGEATGDERVPALGPSAEEVAPEVANRAFAFEEEGRNDRTLHAHFDCFSGAAGDMMFAACLDAAGGDGDRLRDHISRCLSEGLPALAGEFRILTTRVWRGPGSIAAKHIKVESVYNHQPAPLPQRAGAAGNEGATEATHVASHSHQHHSHSHAHQHPDDTIASTPHAESGGQHEHDQGRQTSGPLRTLPEIRRMLQDAPDEWIPRWVKETAVQTFTQLALAEAAVHGAESEDHVHFHEVGAVDSIVDTVGTLMALYYLGVKSASIGKLPLGEGHVKTTHGILPVPTPATLCLMIGMPTIKGPPKAVGELVTPTGAALLQVLTRLNPVSPLGEPPSFTLRHVGVGAGTKDYRGHPNILRVMLGELSKRDSDKSDSLRDSESSANATESSMGL